MNNQLKVSLENIIPLTEARDHFSQIVTEVQKDKLYVLTKGGKPAVAIVDVKYLEAITGGKIRQDHVESEIQKAPEKVGRPKMIEHKTDEDTLKTLAMPKPNDLPPAKPAAQPSFNSNNQTSKPSNFSPYNQPSTPLSSSLKPITSPASSQTPSSNTTGFNQQVIANSNQSGSALNNPTLPPKPLVSSQTVPVLTNPNANSNPTSTNPVSTLSSTPPAQPNSSFKPTAFGQTASTTPSPAAVNPPVSTQTSPSSSPNTSSWNTTVSNNNSVSSSATPVSAETNNITPKTLTAYPIANNTPAATPAQTNQTPAAQPYTSNQAPVASPSVTPAVSIPTSAIPTAPSTMPPSAPEIKPNINPINSAPIWQAQPSINTPSTPASQTPPSTSTSQASPLSSTSTSTPINNQVQNQTTIAPNTASTTDQTLSDNKGDAVIDVVAVADEEIMAKAAKQDQQDKDTFGSSTSEDKPGPAQYTGDSTEEVDDMMLD